jgi:DNA-binding beta-propeller fold protein YncE
MPIAYQRPRNPPISHRKLVLQPQEYDAPVPSHLTNQILRYDGTTGAFLDAFVPAGSGGLAQPSGLVFGPDGNLYVAAHAPSAGQGTVFRYDGTTGAFLDTFIPRGTGGLNAPNSLLYFAPVPEPGSLTLFGLGVSCLFAYAWWRRATDL